MLQSSKLSPAARTLLIAATLGLCLTPIRSQDISARVLTMSGQVSVTSDNRDFKVVNSLDRIHPQQVIVTGPDGYAQFQVSDGSTFEVFSNARVMFRPQLGNWRNLLDIVLGRVKVFIQHPPGKINPNDVSSPTAVISVRGTVFDVEVQDTDGTTAVSVDEGLVDVRNMTAPGSAVRLQPGQSITVFRGRQLVASQIDKSGFFQRALQAARNAIFLRGPRGPQVASVPGSVPGSQGDRGKNPTTGTPGAPGSAPPGPSSSGSSGSGGH